MFLPHILPDMADDRIFFTIYIILLIKVPLNAALAQLIERLICNQRVGGLSPSGGTIKKVPFMGLFL